MARRNLSVDVNLHIGADAEPAVKLTAHGAYLVEVNDMPASFGLFVHPKAFHKLLEAMQAAPSPEF